MPEVFSSTIAWRRRLGFWADVRWTRRQYILCFEYFSFAGLFIAKYPAGSRGKKNERRP